MFFQEIIGPVIELELIQPKDLVPEGVEFSVNHMLTVPHNQEICETLQTNDVVPVARLEAFRALKLSRLESFRALKFVSQS